MNRLFWVVLDGLGHRIPFLRFGRVRHAVCVRMLEHVYPNEQWR